MHTHTHGTYISLLTKLKSWQPWITYFSLHCIHITRRYCKGVYHFDGKCGVTLITKEQRCVMAERVHKRECCYNCSEFNLPEAFTFPAERPVRAAGVCTDQRPLRRHPWDSRFTDTDSHVYLPTRVYVGIETGRPSNVCAGVHKPEQLCQLQPELNAERRSCAPVSER